MKSKNLSEKILRSVRSNGFKYIELDSVIETNHIVQRSGESFRKLIFSFIDHTGNELCLRPDLTIASCLRYLEKNLKKQLIFGDKKGCPVAVIIGESEFNENKFTIKNLKSSKENDQKTVPKESLINEIKKLIWKNP